MIEFQRLLLGDVVRNDAFFRALKSVIVPGKTTVADIGSGTGYLSFLAEQMGAKECFLYEMSALLPISETIGRKNGIKRCRYFGSHSTQMNNPTKTDVVVSETLGNFALEENIIETLNDARRFLKPGGTMIPCGLKQFIAPVITSSLYDELNVWNRLGNLDFSFTKELCMNNMYVKDIARDALLNKGMLWDEIDFMKKNESVRTADIEWIAEKAFTLYGFAIWWEATLFKGITLSTSPYEAPTHWKQIYLPLIDPLPIRSSETIRLHLTSDSRYEVKINVAWETTVVDAKGKILKTVKQDMRKGYLA